jgi:hypothetical protein
MDSKDNTKQYSEEQIQFLQKLVKEQRDLEQQIKILKKAHRERENRKKQVDNTIIKYFKTNDISHVNLQSSNCRLECVTVKSKTGLSQKYVTNMLQELLTDEDLSRDVLDYILSGRQTTEKFKLKAVDNYKIKRQRTKREPKPDINYTSGDRAKLMLKLKDRFNGKIKQKKEDINININETAIDPSALTQTILEKQYSDNNASDVLDVPEIEIATNEEPNIETSNTQSIVKSNIEIDNIINSSADNDIINDIINNNKVNDIMILPIKEPTNIETSIDSFIKSKINNLPDNLSNNNNLQLENSMTDLKSLYNDLMKQAQGSIGMLPPQMLQTN